MATEISCSAEDNGDLQHRLGRRVAGVGLAIAAILGAGTTLASPASANPWGKDINVQRACDDQFRGMGLKAIALDAGNAFSWRCRSPWGYERGVDLARACLTQYAAPGNRLGLASTRNAYSWYCY